VFTKTLHWFLSCAMLIQSISTFLISLKSLVLPFCHVCVGLPRGLFPLTFPSRILYLLVQWNPGVWFHWGVLGLNTKLTKFWNCGYLFGLVETELWMEENLMSRNAKWRLCYISLLSHAKNVRSLVLITYTFMKTAHCEPSVTWCGRLLSESEDLVRPRTEPLKVSLCFDFWWYAFI
jgi:hypothetical protein